MRATRGAAAGRRGNRLASTPPPPGAAPAGSDGKKRKAALGTSNTLSRCTATMLAVAVMPGRRLRSWFSTRMVVV